MTVEEVYRFYGSGMQACKALGISYQNFTHWKKKGYIPLLQQLMLEQLTNGELVASRDHTGQRNDGELKWWTELTIVSSQDEIVKNTHLKTGNKIFNTREEAIDDLIKRLKKMKKEDKT